MVSNAESEYNRGVSDTLLALRNRGRAFREREGIARENDEYDPFGEISKWLEFKPDREGWAEIARHLQNFCCEVSLWLDEDEAFEGHEEMGSLFASANRALSTASYIGHHPEDSAIEVLKLYKEGLGK